MNETDKKIAELKEKIAELEQAREREKSAPGVWVPKDGNTYFYFESTGDVEDYFWKGDETDRDLLSIGNVFPTREAAELHVKRLKVTQRLRELAGGFVPDWKTASQIKYYIYWDCRQNKAGIDFCTWANFPIATYFQDKPSAQHAIDTLGDDLRVLFDVGV